MRRKLLFVLTAGVYLAAVAFGMVKRQTYTDLVKQDNYLSQVQVAELADSMAENVCAVMGQRLPEASIILRVEVTGEIEHLFQADRQKAVIRQVYAGSGLETGEEIYLFSQHWQLVLDSSVDSIERGFVNVMAAGTEYLVFAEAVCEDFETGVRSVKLYDDFLIAPVFSYEEHENVVIPVRGETTYVSYRDVKDNEFLAASEEALRMMEQLKGEMISLYPVGG